MARRLIIVSNRLPVSVQETDDTLSLSRSSGGLATALASLFKPENSLWIGWPGLRRHLTANELQQLDLPPHLALVNLTSREIAGYYDRFANGTLWPLLHGLPATVPYTDASWRAFIAVTKKFADAIEAVVSDTDTIWIHDYHLMLLPAELRRRGIKNRIGFFLHTPFLKPAMLQDLPYAGELIQSLLSVDVMGLQTGRDMLHFDQVCTALNLQAPQQSIVKAFPIGVDFDSFDRLCDEPTVMAMARTFKKQLGSATVILSVSRLDYTKGILTQLEAFRNLISQSPNSARVTYRLNIAPSRESAPEYQALRQTIEQRVDNINTTFGSSLWQPILYTYRNIGPQELAAWYQVADIHLNIPVADGMNLVAKEYIAARRTPGVLVISRTMGAADQLLEALIIPAENSAAAAAALRQALAMRAEEKTKRWEALRHTVKTHHVSDWAQSFLDQLVTKGSAPK